VKDIEKEIERKAVISIQVFFERGGLIAHGCKLPVQQQEDFIFYFTFI
jgi:hypothetical protein